ncbi:hypothetical protein DSO57_1021427 [Entomophthora muscae]|uniref:Uncharacterized protein n=1 Tax=Entomophthora muscae TaxID=34485 RepID=A0ACC2T3D7_9FUNG|nr:hypothetical protein DSO57_1021427 [Entomophthora muscae]
MRKDTGGGKKKSWGKHRAVKAPYVKPGLQAVVPNAWDNNQASCDQSKSRESHFNNDIIGADVAIGPVGKMDGPDWMNNVNATDLHTLEATLSDKQKKEILGQQKLYHCTRVGREKNCLQDVLR